MLPLRMVRWINSNWWHAMFWYASCFIGAGALQWYFNSVWIIYIIAAIGLSGLAYAGWIAWRTPMPFGGPCAVCGKKKNTVLVGFRKDTPRIPRKSDGLFSCADHFETFARTQMYVNGEPDV